MKVPKNTGFPALEFAATLATTMSPDEVRAVLTSEQVRALEDEWSVLLRRFNELYVALVDAGAITGPTP